MLLSILLVLSQLWACVTSSFKHEFQCSVPRHSKDINIPLNREAKNRGQIAQHSSLHILQPTPVREMSSKVQNLPFTKSPLQACQAHLPIAALHTALAHLPLACSALDAHVSAHTKQPHQRATASTSYHNSGKRAKTRAKPITLAKKLAKTRGKYPLSDIQARAEEFVEF